MAKLILIIHWFCSMLLLPRGSGDLIFRGPCLSPSLISQWKQEMKHVLNRGSVLFFCSRCVAHSALRSQAFSSRCGLWISKVPFFCKPTHLSNYASRLNLECGMAQNWWHHFLLSQCQEEVYSHNITQHPHTGQQISLQHFFFTHVGSKCNPEKRLGIYFSDFLSDPKVYFTLFLFFFIFLYFYCDKWEIWNGSNEKKKKPSGFILDFFAAPSVYFPPTLSLSDFGCLQTVRNLASCIMKWDSYRSCIWLLQCHDTPVDSPASSSLRLWELQVVFLPDQRIDRSRRAGNEKTQQQQE